MASVPPVSVPSPPEKILDRLRKLIEHQRSAHAIGNVAEAEAFAAKAQEILLRHKLNMTDIEFAQQEKDEPPAKHVIHGDRDLGTTRRERDAGWVQILLGAVAQANFCKMIRMAPPNRRLYGRVPGYFVLVGRKSDCDAAKALFGYLYESCVTAARNEAASVDFTESFFDFETRGTFIGAFKAGFADAIWHRLETKRSELKAAASEQALVRIDQMERRVEDKVRELFPKLGEPQARRWPANADGYLAGQKYGSAIGINAAKRLKGERA
jgi:hypothetical protein